MAPYPGVDSVMERAEAHEVRRLYSKIDGLEAENQHLKECLSDAADLLATFQARLRQANQWAYADR